MEDEMATPDQSVPYGYCHCRCGEKAPIADQTYTCFGVKKGEPWRFIRGHQRKIRPIPEEAVPFKLHGHYCRLIALTQGQFTIVNESRYIEVMQRKWYARWDEDNRSYYAVARGQDLTESDSRFGFIASS